MSTDEKRPWVHEVDGRVIAKIDPSLPEGIPSEVQVLRGCEAMIRAACELLDRDDPEVFRARGLLAWAAHHLGESSWAVARISGLSWDEYEGKAA